MKRKGNLYNQICSIENLKVADEKARKGKTKSFGVRKFDKKKDQNLLKLHESLISGTYKTSEYHIFKIYKPKEREIYRLPYFPDRIVHHAVMNVLEPVWCSVFTADTYSCIKNRGIHAAARKLKEVLKNDPENTVYCLKIDVKKFYQSIDNDILKQIIRRKIKDTQLLELLDEVIDSAKGVPIGNYLSQYFANLYLAYFDHWIKEKKGVKYYFRYADDMVFLSDNKKVLHFLLNDIREYLDKNLQLEIKSNWQIYPVAARGIDFVGYVFYHTHTGLRKGIKKNLCRKIHRLNKRKKQLSEKEYKQAVCSWWGWLKYCDSKNLIKKLTKKMKYDIKFE